MEDLGRRQVKVLVTGHDGYIGTVLTPMLKAEGHDVTGLDSRLYRDCTFGESPAEIPCLQADVRDVTASDLTGFDAVIHLAGLCNDPLGDLDPEVTLDINFRASVRLAELAREAGVARFLFSSSCSIYGAQGDDYVTEEGAARPVTPYGSSKILAEEGISRLASENFSPTHLRNATVYGASPRLRGDLVVNNLVAYAFTTGEVHIKSDGTPWRPLIHVEDVSRAFVTILHAPRELIHDEVFNVGGTEENYRIREVADAVEATVPGSKIAYAPGAGPDKRNYRVSCDKLHSTLSGFRLKWTVPRGVVELYEAYRRWGLTYEGFLGSRLMRIARVQELLDLNHLDGSLRWQVPRAGAREVTADV